MPNPLPDLGQGFERARELCGRGRRRCPGDPPATGDDGAGDGLLVGDEYVGSELVGGPVDPGRSEPGEGQEELLPQELEGRWAPHASRPVPHGGDRVASQLFARREEHRVGWKERCHNHRRPHPGHLVAGLRERRRHRHRRVDVTAKGRDGKEEAGHGYEASFDSRSGSTSSTSWSPASCRPEPGAPEPGAAGAKSR